ncbi:MAG: hypothetical protein R3234_05815 [Thermoanaerobaculia bacterium]|nr:hypothetical protein [Thermoanaerobaculia bacterium]
MGPRRALSLGILLAAMAQPIPAAREPSIADWLEMQIEVEERILDRARQAYRRTRSLQEQEEARLATLEARLDDLLGSERPDRGTLRRLEDSVREVRVVVTDRADRAAELREEIGDQIARIELLSDLRANLPRREDPLSGQWELQIFPQGQMGIMDLDLDGTLVTGTYVLDGGFTGSLRGTFVGNHVRLERIDAERGFDIVYEGDLDTTTERIEGGWRATHLTRPGPTGGEWIAHRSETGEEETIP